MDSSTAGVMRYPTLLSPKRVGVHTLRNRVIMGSMHTRLEHAANPVERQAAFYAARAAGGAALIITGGFAPNEAGRLEEGGPLLDAKQSLDPHRVIADEVHRHDARILLQILHAGRYAKHDNIVGVSDIRSPINPRAPKPLTDVEIEQTIEAFVNCARLAAQAGYDGVEVMGSEGYLINQFTAPRTNSRGDRWGGPLENRLRFPVEIVQRIRAALGPSFLIMYRISAIDLVENGLTADEIDAQALAVEAAGADILNTGIGWHEARVPTIAFSVPRAAFAFAVKRLRKSSSIPIVASNRINTPESAERLLAGGACDFISMARPLLADPDFVRKTEQNRANEINTCIACNQACLDFIFSDRIATCLVNPIAGNEIDFARKPMTAPKRIAVVGSGPAGLSAAVTAAGRGHRVILFEEQSLLGGQIHLARAIPTKGEFNELLRYFMRQIEVLNVSVSLGARVTANELARGKFDEIIIATGIIARRPAIPGIDRSNVVGYADVILGHVKVGKRVAIIGAGGIAHDVAELLTHSETHSDPVQAFLDEYGVDPAISGRGGLKPPSPPSSPRQVTLFQRRRERPGSHLGVSTGWILRNHLRAKGVEIIAGVTYDGISERGLHYSADGTAKLFEVDHVVICAGQEPNVALASELNARGLRPRLIGGAERAGELDALRAIREGVELAYSL